MAQKQGQDGEAFCNSAARKRCVHGTQDRCIAEKRKIVFESTFPVRRPRLPKLCGPLHSHVRLSGIPRTKLEENCSLYRIDVHKSVRLAGDTNTNAHNSPKAREREVRTLVRTKVRNIEGTSSGRWFDRLGLVENGIATRWFPPFLIT